MSDTQQAVLAQIARSTRVEMITKISRLIDLIEALFVSQEDRDWFADNMLGGEWKFEDQVLAGLNAIADAFNVENRAQRRAKATPAKKATARRPR